MQQHQYAYQKAAAGTDKIEFKNDMIYEKVSYLQNSMAFKQTENFFFFLQVFKWRDLENFKVLYSEF